MAWVSHSQAAWVNVTSSASPRCCEFTAYRSNVNLSSAVLCGSHFTNANLRGRIPVGKRSVRRYKGTLVCLASAEGQETELVAFLGKGGVGKTSAAILLAQSYAAAGRKTCLVVQSADKSADSLLGFPIGSSVAEVHGSNLSCVRLETTKLLLEPLAELKKADARLGLSQGALDEVVGEELSVLPGMDSALAVAVIEKLARPAGGLLARMGATSAAYDTVVFDGPSSSELLRILGAAERTRWYLRRARAALEKTDGGRVALPSVARLLESFVSPEDSGRGAASTKGGGGGTSSAAGTSTSGSWEAVDKAFARATASFLDPGRFACFLVAREDDVLSQDSALRLWGGAMQAGLAVSGALLLPAPGTPLSDPPPKDFTERFQPLPTARFPRFDTPPKPIDWSTLTTSFKAQPSSPQFLSQKARKSHLPSPPPPVSISAAARTVALFLPGFDKSEVKLSQWRGGSELLVDVGDQRRSILLPVGMRGKVTGAKFSERVLTVTIGKS